MPLKEFKHWYDIPYCALKWIVETRLRESTQKIVVLICIRNSMNWHKIRTMAMEKGLFKRYYKVKLGTFAAGMYVGKWEKEQFPNFLARKSGCLCHYPIENTFKRAKEVCWSGYCFSSIVFYSSAKLEQSIEELLPPK